MCIQSFPMFTFVKLKTGRRRFPRVQYQEQQHNCTVLSGIIVQKNGHVLRNHLHIMRNIIIQWGWRKQKARFDCRYISEWQSMMICLFCYTIEDENDCTFYLPPIIIIIIFIMTIGQKTRTKIRMCGKRENNKNYYDEWTLEIIFMSVIMLLL